MSYEYKIYHKETGEEIPQDEFSQYVAMDTDGDLVEFDSRDGIEAWKVDYAYIKFNKADEYEAKAKLADEIIKSFYEIREDMKDKLVGYELGYQTIGTEVSKYIKRYESSESNE